MKQYGFGSATNIAVSGCSAGGLSALLHTNHIYDAVHRLLPSLRKYRTIPMSGFFLNHKTVEGAPVFPTLMQNMANMVNVSGPVTVLSSPTSYHLHPLNTP